MNRHTLKAVDTKPVARCNTNIHEEKRERDVHKEDIERSIERKKGKSLYMWKYIISDCD